jgi:RsiW-degrading membrane proteinase PrsW (M82 family)
MNTLYMFLLAFIASLIPVLIWLIFLEHKDKHPEPKKLIALSFFAGFLAVIFVLPLEKIVSDSFESMSIMVVCWAAIEELAKYAFAYLFVLRRAENDEPIDGLMYIIAVALGFSALENAFFLANPLLDGDLGQAFLISNFRFIGATLLHTVSSSIIGLALAFSFYKAKTTQALYLFVGIILAIILHTFFNLTIIASNGSKTMIAFYTVWVGLVIILLLIERAKKVNKT